MVRQVTTGLIIAAACALVFGCEEDSLISVDGGTDAGDSGAPPVGGGTDTGLDTGMPTDTGPDAGMPTDTGPDAGMPTDTAALPGDLEIAGTYVSDFDEQIEITNTSWVSQAVWGTSSYTVTQYDNEDDFLVAQNSSDDDFNPELWSRFEWTIQGTVYYCQTLYAAETEAEAVAAGNLADKTDLAAGCAGFSWTGLTPEDEYDAGLEDGGDPDAGM